MSERVFRALRHGGAFPGPPAASIRLSLVIPTAGRPSLARALASIAPQAGPGDEVIVLCEPGDAASAGVFARSGLAGACVADETPGPTRWGYKARALGIRLARNPWLHVIGDDDVYLPGALGRVRAFLAGLARPVPVLFRMHRGGGFGDTLWRVPRLTCGNVAGEMLVVPNDPARFGTFADSYDGDFHFIRGTACRYGGRVAWSADPIVRWRDDG